MKTKTVLIAIMTCWAITAPALEAQQRSALGLRVREHRNHSAFEKLPFGNGDLSFAIAYEFREENAFWQVVLDFAPEATGIEPAGYVITPEINLMFEDGYWHGGLGAMYSHVEEDEIASPGAYWQLMVGLQSISDRHIVRLTARYVFEEWSRLDDFDGSDIEFGLTISRFF